jgi:hypothetical protein
MSSIVTHFSANFVLASGEISIPFERSVFNTLQLGM